VSAQGKPEYSRIHLLVVQGRLIPATSAQDDPNGRKYEFQTQIPQSQPSLSNLKYLFPLKPVIPLEQENESGLKMVIDSANN